MAAKKITIVVLPDGNSKVRQLRIPMVLIGLSCFFSLAAVLVFSWIVGDYHAAKREIHRLVALEKENQDQKTQLAALADRIDEMGRRLGDLKEFDKKLKVMVNLESSEDDTQLLGMGGSDLPELDQENTGEENREFVRLMHKSLDDLDTEISIQTTEKSDLITFFENRKSILACTPSIWPTKGWVSSRFGYRISPFTNEREFHKGMDICNRINAPIVASADGVVVSVRNDYGYGRILTINHDHGLKTRYAHLEKALVKKGQHVKRGQKIALVGNSGRTTGPHLHYEVLLNGVAVNPSHYILN